MLGSPIMQWPVIRVRFDKWEPCPLCTQAPIPAPRLGADFQERIEHYGIHHDYGPATITKEKLPDGTVIEVATVEHP